MPYIKKEYRKLIDPEIDALIAKLNHEAWADEDFGNIQKTGVLNYIITKIALGIGFSSRYGNMNDIIGAMECCKLELYRRFAIPYENKKILENGDVVDE